MPRIGVQPDALSVLYSATPSEEVRQRQGPRQHEGACPKFGLCDQRHLMLDYVDARYVMEALDRLGPENWQDVYFDRDGGSVRCGIGILVDGDWVWKWDVGTTSDIEPEKGSYSEAFKRAAVKWGVARDLYGHKAKSQAPRQQAAPAQRPAAVPMQTPVDKPTPVARMQTPVDAPPLPLEPGFSPDELASLAQSMDGVLHEPGKAAPPAFGGEPPCPIHHVAMRRNSRGLWHSTADGGFCHGKVER